MTNEKLAKLNKINEKICKYPGYCENLVAHLAKWDLDEEERAEIQCMIEEAFKNKVASLKREFRYL